MSVNLESLVIDQHGDIKLLDGFNFFYGDTAKKVYGDLDQYSDEGIAAFTKFCEEHGITYYGRPGEDFFMYEAWMKAEEEGNTYLLADNMS